MRILIYGAGVIGSLYAALFSKVGYEVSVHARGRRLQELKTKGLLYRDGGTIQKADVTVLAQLSDEDCYAFIFLTVRAEQAESALYELQRNISPTIVTMINTIRDYAEWEAIHIVAAEISSSADLPAIPLKDRSDNGFQKSFRRCVHVPPCHEITGRNEAAAQRFL